MKTISKIKQILMQSFSKAIALFVALFIFSLSSCEKPNSNDDPSNDTPTDTTAFVMVYEDFITPEDVIIENSDTTEISISQMFAEKMGIETFTGRTVTIWRSINTVPFVRKITGEKVEGDKIIITSVRGEFADMFENLDLNLNTDLYINRDYNAPKRTRRHASGPVVNDVSAKYTDAEGIIHPAVIIFEEKEMNSPTAQRLMTRTGTQKNYFTAEELLANNLSFDLINFNNDFEYDFPIGEDSVIHLMGKLGAESKLSAYANISVGFFKLKKFETGVNGSIMVASKSGLGVKIDGEKEWEHEFISFGKTNVVFWAGPIPIAFSIEPAITGNFKIEAGAGIQLLTSAKVGASFSTGCRYKDGKWEGLGTKTETIKDFKLEGIYGSAEAAASLGVFISTDILLAGTAGPTLSAGPSVSLEASAQATAPIDTTGINSVDIEATIGAYAGLSAELGAKINFLGYKLGKWSTTLEIFKVLIAEKTWKFSYSDDEYWKYKNEWTTALDKPDWAEDFTGNEE